MTETQQRVYTAEDLLRMADGKRYELINGELIEMAPTNITHGVLTARLSYFIAQYSYATKSGIVVAAETGFKVSTDPETVIAPDIAYISVVRAQPLTEKFGEIAPDLAVEVVSPGNSAGELREKVDLFFKAGTRQVWIVYPKLQTVDVYTSATSVRILTRQDTLDGADVLPGFTLPLEELFSVLGS